MIDWFTVCAQVINFVILAWLMKRFLFKPILAAIDARETLIAGELSAATSKQAAAESGRLAFEKKAGDFDQQRAALLSKATTDATVWREKMLADARQAADDLSAERRDALAAESKSIADAVGRRARQEVFAIARRTLNDLGGVSVQACIVDAFCRRVRATPGPTRARLGEALSSGSIPAVVRTAVELPAEGRAAVQQSLNETFAADVPLRYETVPALIGGIELVAGGHKVVWSIDEYLCSLEKGIAEVFGRKSVSAPDPVTATLGAAEGK
ncbi:MAG: synthase subunit [Phycisphaerales bacterium]|nr:synthase subunit [Phycisphaerales bacterium]